MDRRRTAWTGALLGIGLAGTLDEVLLHQILHWHHFYDRSTSAVGLVSDGLFHVASTMLLLYGMYRLGQHRSWQIPGWACRFWAGVLLGLGGFNLYDGVIQHKVLRLHQVRPGVAHQLPYDAGFIGIATAILLAGLILLRAAHQPDGHDTGRAADDWQE